MLYTIFGGDKVIVTDTDPKLEPQSILIEGKVRSDLYNYVIPSSILQNGHPLYSTNNDKSINNTTTYNKEHNAMYLICNTIDISKPPTIHDPNDTEKNIKGENR
eukprot:Pgem_evm1s15649